MSLVLILKTACCHGKHSKRGLWKRVFWCRLCHFVTVPLGARLWVPSVQWRVGPDGTTPFQMSQLWAVCDPVSLEETNIFTLIGGLLCGLSLIFANTNDKQ